MTQVFTEDGRAIPVTVIAAGPCVVVQKKTNDKDGYTALQIGWSESKKVKKPQAGHLRGLPQVKILREVRIKNEEEVKLDQIDRGDEIRVSTFTVGEKVNVVGISKGKGFQGVVKRHGFAGSPASHGHKDQLRMPGSIGATDPARVFKGTRMAGRMGADQVTVKNLEVVKIDEENNFLYIKGAVPGPRGGLVKIVGSGELKVVKPAEIKEEEKNDNQPSSQQTEESLDKAAEQTAVDKAEDGQVKETKENKEEQVENSETDKQAPDQNSQTEEASDRQTDDSSQIEKNEQK